jgi:hypothetical protein
MGAAIAFFVSVLMQNAVSVGSAWYLDRFPTLNAGTGVVLLVLSALLLGNASGLVDGWVTASGMMVVLMAMAFRSWEDMVAVYRRASI